MTCVSDVKKTWREQSVFQMTIVQFNTKRKHNKRRQCYQPIGNTWHNLQPALSVGKLGPSHHWFGCSYWLAKKAGLVWLVRIRQHGLTSYDLEKLQENARKTRVSRVSFSTSDREYELNKKTAFVVKMFILKTLKWLREHNSDILILSKIKTMLVLYNVNILRHL